MTNNNPLVKKGMPKFPTGGKVEKGEEVAKPTPTVNNAISEFYTPPTKIKNKQVSIYLDEDVIEAFNKFGNEHGKGSKSELVNNFLKQVFDIRQG